MPIRSAFGQKRTIDLANGGADRLLFQRYLSQLLLFRSADGRSGRAATLGDCSYIFGVSANGQFMGAVTLYACVAQVFTEVFRARAAAQEWTEESGDERSGPRP